MISTKTVSLDEEAYKLLKKKKEKGESFSDVVKKMTKEKSLLELAGMWKDEELRSKITDARKSTEEDLDSIFEG